MSRSIPIPLKLYRIPTDLPRAEAVARIEEWMELRQSFQGKVSTRRFALARRIGYANSFLPIVHGRFEPVDGGYEVRYRLTFHPVVLGMLFVFAVQVAIWSIIPPEALLVILSATSLAALGSWIFEAPRMIALLKECLETERLEVT